MTGDEEALHRDKQLVFVYGTLRHGEENHHLLAQDKMLGKAVTANGFAMLDFGDYPAVVQHGRYVIVGEVYEIAGGTLTRLDELEEYPDYYQRIIISTRYGNAWMYVLNEVSGVRRPLVECGDWVKYRAHRQVKSAE